MQRMFATARMCVREQGYFGLAELVSGYLIRAVTLLALLMIWHGLFSQGADTGGLTLPQMLSYTLMSSVLYPLLNVRTPASSWLHDGTMLGLYQRPVSLFGQLAAHTVGGWAMYLAIFSIPVIVIGALCGIPVRPASAWFVPSLILAVAEGFAVDYLFTCLLIRMKNMEWPVHAIREALNVMLTGALIPFAALPWGIGDWLSLSPLGMLAGAPLALYAGLDTPARLIPAQLFWTVTLWPLALWCFNRSRERMVSYGG